MLKGSNFRKVLLNLSNEQIERISENLRCDNLIVVIEDKIYPRIKDMKLKDYKTYIEGLLMECKLRLAPGVYSYDICCKDGKDHIFDSAGNVLFESEDLAEIFSIFISNNAERTKNQFQYLVS